MCAIIYLYNMLKKEANSCVCAFNLLPLQTKVKLFCYEKVMFFLM